MRNGGMRAGGFEIEVVEGLGSRREEIEREAEAAGFHLPLSHTLAWARAHNAKDGIALVLRHGDGLCRGLIVLDRAPSRALPGHQLLRAHRVGSAVDPEVHAAVGQALVMLAQQLPRVLRLSVELFTPDAEQRASLALSLADAGFRGSAAPRSYAETLVLDLTPDEDRLFEALRAKTRRDIRAAARHGLEVHPVTDVAFADRLEDLFRETMARTHGPLYPHDWRALIELSIMHPSRARVAGLFSGDDVSPSSLVAFAFGCGHGDHAEYSVSASTRGVDRRVPLTYAPLWDLVIWAKRNGATWFDFGGVTRSRLSDAVPLGGISDFKRYFSEKSIAVGEEWVLEPRPARAGLAHMVSAGAAWLTAVRART